MRLPDLLNLDPDQIIEDRLLRWTAAFDAWLAERRARFGTGVAPASLSAWREFLAFTGKPPWEINAADVQAHVAALKKRKLRPRTIANHLSRLSQFYAYGQAHAVDPLCEPGFNPVAAVSRPRREDLETARYLTQSEEASLLAALRRDPSPLGQRDYALFLLLLRTGWKAGADSLVSLDKNEISVKLDLVGNCETDKIFYTALRYWRFHPASEGQTIRFKQTPDFDRR